MQLRGSLTACIVTDRLGELTGYGGCVSCGDGIGAGEMRKPSCASLASCGDTDLKSVPNKKGQGLTYSCEA